MRMSVLGVLEVLGVLGMGFRVQGCRGAGVRGAGVKGCRGSAMNHAATPEPRGTDLEKSVHLQN
jgi:hypothetical protein